MIGYRFVDDHQADYKIVDLCRVAVCAGRAITPGGVDHRRRMLVVTPS